MIRRITFAVIGLTCSSAASAEAYLCSFGNIYSLTSKGDSVSGAPIQFGQETNPAWQFRLIKTEREVEIVWPSSPLQFNGKASAIQTGPTSFAAFMVGRGPCMFTEGHCGATLHYSQQDDGSLMFHFQPIALTRFEDGHREPLKVLAEGTCTPADKDQ
jgi:hypothetical protein